MKSVWTEVVGRLILAVLTVEINIQSQHKERDRHGYWKEATPDETDKVEEAVADMVATYASQVN